ncbi:transcriptional regulator [Alkalicaulis satelles]|uniref:Transcriptional regulator n=1 Tax=Alkalicaulis satelles TaxID=2609175 RepID=A0A5M6ZFE4_9PROT|nr:type II toxin-antitoxin system MqsA family antitoxin [Alkalicaulis satelles]KAA5803466.1 transcriptional regulator [Alkalicaulis satelles]
MSEYEKNLIQGLEEALAIVEGKAKPTREGWVEVPAIDVAGIRARMELSQTEFARKFGFNVTAVRNWEQGRRTPHGPARILLHTISKHPDVIESVLSEIEAASPALLMDAAPD